MRTKIYITQRDNDRYFKQKLPTWRNGFCHIERKVTIITDPYAVYSEGEYGYITINNAKVIVVGDHIEFCIQ